MKKLFTIGLLLASALSWAEIKLDPVFSSNMLLQQNRPVVFFGTGTPNSEFTLNFDNKSLTGTIKEDGSWSMEFPAHKASYIKYKLDIKEGDSVARINNIVFGDVWVCAGQSNMEMPIGATFRSGWSAKNCEEEVANAKYPFIRYVSQAKRISFQEKLTNPIFTQNNTFPKQGWMECSPEVASNFSATGYFFARKLNQDLNIPIGLIVLPWSGTKIEPWISLEGYQAAGLESDLKKIANNNLDEETRKAKRAEDNARYEQEYKKWKKEYDALPEAEQAKAKAKAPKKKVFPWEDRQFYCNNFNGMLPPWTRLPVKGVIWYQGCSNAGQPHYYLLQKALINDWRKQWNNPEMPFIITQLASFDAPDNWKELPPAKNPSYPLTRDIQEKVANEMENVGIACTIDIGERTIIHPANKQDVGLRLALEAERIAYKMAIVSRGPEFDTATVENNAIRVAYKNADNGLKTVDGQEPVGFAIAGADGNFVWANAVIDGKTVVVSSPDVPEPAFVRYAYTQFRDDYNLQNAEGLPAYPFRSDAIDYANIK